MLAGAVVTALVQSSSVFVVMVQALVADGAVPLSSALALVAGANIGTCTTALIAAARGCDDSKRLAVWHVLFNLAGGLLFLLLRPLFIKLAEISSLNAVAQVANGHLLFNLAAGILMFPLVPLIVPVLIHWQPGKPGWRRKIR